MTDETKIERPQRPLWFNQCRQQLRWEVYNGAVIFDYPKVLKPDEIDDLEDIFALLLKGLRRTSLDIADTIASAAKGPPHD